MAIEISKAPSEGQSEDNLESHITTFKLDALSEKEEAQKDEQHRKLLTHYTTTSSIMCLSSSVLKHMFTGSKVRYILITVMQFFVFLIDISGFIYCRIFQFTTVASILVRANPL